MKQEVQFLRAQDVAPLLGVSTGRVYQIIRAGRLPVVREGRSILLPRAAWDEWLRRRSEAALRVLSQTGDTRSFVTDRSN